MKLREIQDDAVMWWDDYWRDFGRPDADRNAAYRRMTARFTPPEVVRSAHDVLDDAIEKITEVLRQLRPGQDAADTATLMREQGLDPSVKSDRMRIDKMLRTSNLLERIPSQRERYVRRITHDEPAGHAD